MGEPQPQTSLGQAVRVPDQEEMASYASEIGQSVTERALDRADAAIAVMKQLQRTTFAMTFHTDWVVMGDFAFLKEHGCQRVTGLWGISFDRLDIRKDIIREELETGDIEYQVYMVGESTLTGRQHADIGCRSTAGGFFKDRWKDAENEPAKRRQLELDVKKAAIANARGRVIRALTGTNGMPVEMLKKHGIEPGQKVAYQTGTKGGSGTMATEPQLKRIAMICSKEGRIKGLGDYKKIVQYCEEAHLSKKGASTLMDWLGTLDPKASTTSAAFFAHLGAGPPPSQPQPEAPPVGTRVPRPPSQPAAPAEPVDPRDTGGGELPEDPQLGF